LELGAGSSGISGIFLQKILEKNFQDRKILATISDGNQKCVDKLTENVKYSFDGQKNEV